MDSCGGGSPYLPQPSQIQSTVSSLLIGFMVIFSDTTLAKESILNPAQESILNSAQA